jgi:hypothetical protein
MAEQLSDGDARLTGWSKSSCPRPTRRATLSAATALPTEKTLTSVSRSQGRRHAESLQPPHRSATTVPSTTMHTDAPISPRRAKFSVKA